MPLQREKDIGQRLRVFRETLGITRTSFAVALGIGTDRLASYESGRVPLRYSVFRLIAGKFQLNPYWLATGEGAARIGAIINEAPFANNIRPSATFSTVFDKFLALPSARRIFEVDEKLTTALKALKSLEDFFAWASERSGNRLEDHLPMDIIEQMHRLHWQIEQLVESSRPQVKPSRALKKNPRKKSS